MLDAFIIERLREERRRERRRERPRPHPGPDGRWERRPPGEDEGRPPERGCVIVDFTI